MAQVLLARAGSTHAALLRFGLDELQCPSKCHAAKMGRQDGLHGKEPNWSRTELTCAFTKCPIKQDIVGISSKVLRIHYGKYPSLQLYIISVVTCHVTLMCCSCQVQLDYSSSPTLLYGFTKSFVAFLKDTGVIAETADDALARLEDEFGIRIVETDRTDDDKVPFVLSPPELPLFVVFRSQTWNLLLA